MTDAQITSKITFPQIVAIRLEKFDLYSLQPDIDVTIDREVFCLIGANGLGKSTFLNTINYAMTGAVPDPKRKFQSADEYYAYVATLGRTKDYFDGRISEQARPFAKVTVKLSWPSKTLEVTRNIFEGSSISHLAITDKTTNHTCVESMDDGVETETIKARYEKAVLELTGLKSFAQFVFHLHFIATFDEGRHLLLWDKDAATNALYLAFGTDPSIVQIIEKLGRDMQRASSQARNLMYSARHVSKRIEELIERCGGEDNEDRLTDIELQTQYNSLLTAYEDTENRFRNIQNQLRDTELKWVALSAQLTENQLEYRRLFSQRLQKTPSVALHPLVQTSLAEDICAICGSVHISAAIKIKVDANECPLCQRTVPESSSEDQEIIQKLHGLDTNIIELNEKLKSILKTRERLGNERTLAECNEMSAREALQSLTNENSAALTKINIGGSSNLRAEIAEQEVERDKFKRQSDEQYKRRDEFREKLRVYETEFKAQYTKGAQTFVPRFRELAESFIGLAVDVELEHRQGVDSAGFGLRLQMNDKLRLGPEMLSESQRFFLDIALRMALSEQMTGGASTLLIDTPEGSLDIAYEARAGVMFSKYVDNGNFILMTANLRSSHLVLRLAGLQHDTGMQVARMTDWTELSEVQRSEEGLFLKAYEAIDDALKLQE